MDTPHPVQVVPMQMPPRRPGLGGWFALLFAIALLISIGFNLVLISFSLQGQSIEMSADNVYQESIVDEGGQDATDKILLIDIAEPISSASTTGQFGMAGASIVERTLAQLRTAQKDPYVKAIIINIDTPGGGVDASEMIYNEVMKTKKSGSGKKILIQMNGVCASGGYYISAPADHIVAHPTTITGSIGVIAQFMTYHKALEYLNVQSITIKSGEKKDWGSPFDEFTDAERKYLQGIIDHAYARFISIVEDGRGDKISDVEALATGEVFTADQAKENGLIDEIGFLDDTIAKARELIGSKAPVIRYSTNTSLLTQLMGAEAEGPININTGLQIDLLKQLDYNPRFMYMWHVGN